MDEVVDVPGMEILFLYENGDERGRRWGFEGEEFVCD